MSITRRDVLAMAGATAAGLCVAGPADALDRRPREFAFRRSARGRRASPAVKIRNANLRYKTRSAALGDLAHPGDTSYVVRIDVDPRTFRLWFPRGSDVVDLRQLPSSR
jgi:hypothetical protein